MSLPPRAPTLADLPPPPPGRTGWPWTEQTEPAPEAESRHWPRVSVVTPSYMQGEFLEETIRSVLLQGVPQLEYIVMDGGSRDETVAILKKYEPWLACWRSEKDRGQVDAINKGLAVASGEIVAYLNSDDWYHPGALQAVVRRAAAHPEESWWVGWVDNRTEGQPPDRKPSTFTNMVEFMGRTEAMQQPGVFWRKGLEEQVGLFDPTMHFVFDHEYFVRFARLGIRPVDLQVPIANFRIHGGSKTYSKQYLFMRELWDSTRRHRDAVTPAEWPEVVRRVRQYEAHYFVQSVYGVLEKGDRWAAIGYLLRSLALAPLVKPLRLYLGAWCRVLFAGRPPEWFGQAPASSR